MNQTRAHKKKLLQNCWFIDVDAGATHRNFKKGKCMTMLSSRPKGFYVTSHGRMLKKSHLGLGVLTVYYMAARP